MKLTEWRLKRKIDELVTGVSGSSYLVNNEIALLKSRVNELEEIPPGGVTSYNDLTDKPTIPDELADLSADATHRLVTDTEKANFLTSVEKAKLPQMIIFTYNL